MSATLEVCIPRVHLDASEQQLLCSSYQTALRFLLGEPSLTTRLVFRAGHHGFGVEAFVKETSLDTLLRFRGKRFVKGAAYLRPLVECSLMYGDDIDVRFTDETNPAQEPPVTMLSLDRLAALPHLPLNHCYRVSAPLQWFVVREIEAKLMKPLALNGRPQQATHFYKAVWIRTTRAEIARSIATALIEGEGAIILHEGTVEQEHPRTGDPSARIVQGGHIYFSDASG